jgi:hypothetical protein
MEGSGHGLILRYYSRFFQEKLREITKTQVRITGLRAEI